MSKKLLLADDSITIQKVIQITFAHEDYELTITDNGDTAMEKALQIKPDLVMADVYMPGKNGYELATAIKQNPELQHVAVLLLAGSFEPFDEDKARNSKADAWIEKPFESQALIDKVAELLSAVKPAAKAPDLDASVSYGEPLVATTEVSFDTEPQSAATIEDPFGDISFEEEIPSTEPEAPAFHSDWSDVVLEPPEEKADDNIFAAANETASEVDEDFALAEEESLSSGAFASVDEELVSEPGFDPFDMDEDEILPLGEDDILGAEDLEPLKEEQTLAAWSRSETDEEDIATPIDEEPFAEESVFVTPGEGAFEETSTFAFENSAFIEPSADVSEKAVPFDAPSKFEEPAEESAVTITSIEDVEAKASGISEHEIEQIVERVVSKVVQKLAQSILEKVAWEVVPDMAENMIREEIRKIKDAAA